MIGNMGGDQVGESAMIGEPAAKPFSGEIKLDIRDSTPDWDAFLPDKAPQGAPNVLVVLYDDTGLAAWSPFGGRIAMPTMQKLADNGLTYSQWHTTALCSPTRSVFLTGRNHHQNGFASISETSTGFPGYNSHIPRENATLATVAMAAYASDLPIGARSLAAGPDVSPSEPRIAS